MKLLSDKLKTLNTESAFQIGAQVGKLRSQGKDIIGFHIGEPDFDTPQNIKDAAVEALMQNKTHYAVPAGIPELRNSVAEYISETRGIRVDPKNIIIGPGAKPVIAMAMQALINPGDEVICPNPGYPGYYANAGFYGADVVSLPLLEKNNFGFDVSELESLITKKTKLLVMNSPQNPTGGVLTKKDIMDVAALAKEHDLYVLSDEIYSRILYEGEHFSIMKVPGMQERTLLVDGWSKIYSMTGWRLGFMTANDDIMKYLPSLLINMVSSTATFTQYAGIEALVGPQDDPARMVKEFKERRDLIVEGLNSIPGFSCRKPQGAFYVFPNVTELCKKTGLKDSTMVQNYLLGYDGPTVSLLSRFCFGGRNVKEHDEYVRLSFANSKENIVEGVKRLKNAFADKRAIESYLSR